jgi:GT2 family glycosyltransferase
MHHPENSDRSPEVADELQKLRAEFAASERQIARILEILEIQQSQLTSQDASIARLDRILMDLLTGRTWRTLRAAGRFLGRLTPGRANGTSGDPRAFLVCDEPKPNDTTPRTGKIAVRGWCLAEGGVDSVRIEVPGLPHLETTPCVARPDIKKSQPQLDQTGRSGFSAEFDSLPLSKGRHRITLKLISSGRVVREARTAVYIDHERAFASDYERWIEEFERPDDRLIELQIANIQVRPLISIIMPVYNTDPRELTAAIQSVLDQSIGNWELCIADDGSSESEPKEILKHFAAQDSRIKVAFQERRGGISRASNAALQMSTGDYVCWLDHDDTLAPHALAYICEALYRSGEADLLYSDEDKIDRAGNRFDPFFKPEWSPDLLLSENYLCHLLVLRRDLLARIGDFNSDCDGSQDYDLILRATAEAKKIRHIPKVLYHWRAGLASTASGAGNKQYALDAAREALQRHCDRISNQMRVEATAISGRWRVRYPIPEGSRVSIIICSGGKVEVLRTNLTSLFDKTTYPDYEVVIVDNSKGGSIEKLVRSFQTGSRTLRYIDSRNQPFNFSKLNNSAARACESPVLLFLNDDTSVITSDWLESMVELAARPEVGAVGAKLLYPGGIIQHAGIVMGLYDNCGHAFKGLDGHVGHYFDFSDVIRNVSAVTGACLMARAKVFWEAGGFDDTDFPVAFNDADLCLKIGRLGYRVLYTPHALLFHHEAFSKTSKHLIPHPEEVAAMRAKWADIIAGDPYYSPNLTRNDEDYSLRTRN